MSIYGFRILLVVYAAMVLLELVGPVSSSAVPAVVEDALVETLARGPNFGQLLRGVYYLYLGTTLLGLVAVFFLRAWGFWVLLVGLALLLVSSFLVPWTYATAWETFRSEVFWFLSGVVLWEAFKTKKPSNFLEPMP